MITFNDKTGETVIDFPDLGPITVKPPKFGAYKRIQRERERLADDLIVTVMALPALDPLPEDEDQSDTARNERLRLTPIYRQRNREIEDLTSGVLAATWKFILCGDDTFAGLANPKPPEDTDDWPTDLLVDAAETEIVNGKRVRTNETVIDAWLKHAGKAQVSGSTAGHL